MPEIIPGSTLVRGPEDETSRESLRIGRRCSLLITEGIVTIVDKRGEELAVSGPAVVQWWPGEDVIYRAASSDARWLFQPSTLINPPLHLPAIGSLVRLTSQESDESQEGTVVGYAGEGDASDAEARFITIDTAASGVSIIDLRNYHIDLVETPSSGL